MRCVGPVLLLGPCPGKLPKFLAHAGDPQARQAINASAGQDIAGLKVRLDFLLAVTLAAAVLFWRWGSMCEMQACSTVHDTGPKPIIAFPG